MPIIHPLFSLAFGDVSAMNIVRQKNGTLIYIEFLLNEVDFFVIWKDSKYF